MWVKKLSSPFLKAFHSTSFLDLNDWIEALLLFFSFPMPICDIDEVLEQYNGTWSSTGILAAGTHRLLKYQKDTIRRTILFDGRWPQGKGCYGSINLMKKHFDWKTKFWIFDNFLWKFLIFNRWRLSSIRYGLRRKNNDRT